jgi:hypothetical protein
MRSAELATAVRTLKRKKSFFPALLALHAQSAPFMLRDKVSRLYVSLRNRSVPINIHFPFRIFSEYDSISQVKAQRELQK